MNYEQFIEILVTIINMDLKGNFFKF